MKVLFLPLNIASIPSITADALNKIDGIEAVCITNIISPIQSRGTNTIFIPKKFPRRKPLQWVYHKLTYKSRIKKWLKWADILHYTWETAFDDGSDLEMVSKMNKPLFIEWLGSDIRNPDILKKINKYYSKVFDNGYEYKELEESDHSRKVQEQFSFSKATPLLNPEMSLYLDKKLFPKGATMIMPRLNIKNFNPKYPNKNNKRPLVIHSPSARICKGSEFVIKAVEKLKETYDFDFKLIENIPRTEALNLMSECDIFIDQLILGSYGLASIEAMSFGKPVICFIMPEVYEAGLPGECPIINANPDNLLNSLELIISNGHMRNEIGKKGRLFVEQYHDVDVVSRELINHYSKKLIKHNQNL